MIHIIQRLRGVTPSPSDLASQPARPRPAVRPPHRRSIRGLASCRRGVVAVEFAMASVPLMILCFGFIATSSVYNTWGNMQTNTQYAARLMSTSGSTLVNTNGAFSTTNTSSSVACSSSKVTSATVEYYACNGLPSWATYTVTTSENCALSTPSVTVSLSASATAAAIADVENFFSGKTITAQTVFMKEGSCP
jgi:Flp pilus assembly protein TadG